MIVGGHSTTGKGLAGYLTTDKNDRAEIWNIRGCELPELSEALHDWKIDAANTQAEKPLYHAWLRPSDTDKELSREDWEKAIALFEKELGFENQPRAIVYHHGEGQGAQGHVHLVYSRIQDGRAISNSHNYVKHEKARAEIEKELGLEHVYSPHLDRDQPRRAQGFDRDEMEQGKRLKIDPREVKAEVSTLYQSADNGKAFAAALDEAGYTLAQGDRRAYVILDQAGGVHSLAKMAGVKVAELRERLKDFSPENLPSVGEARALQQERQREAEKNAPEIDRKAEARAQAAPTPTATKTAGEIRLAYSLSDNAPSFAAALDERRIILVRATAEEAAQSHRKAEFSRQFGNYAPRIAEGEIVALNERGHLYRLNERTTGHSRAEVQNFLGSLDRAALPSLEEGRQAQQDRAELRQQQEREKRSEDLKRQEVGKTAGEIRLAYTLSDSAQGFAEALNERGFKLASVSAEEAAQSHRKAEFSREVGHYAPRLVEGEIVALNERGHLYRLNERTTGDSPAEVEKFLGTLDRAELHSIEATREAFKQERENRNAPDPERKAAAVAQIAFLKAHNTEGPKARDIDKTLQQHAKEGRPLDDEQAAAVRHAAENAFSIIQGRAGTGKSYTLNALRETYESAGFEVIALAPTHTAANDLREAGFTEARTLQSFLYREEKRLEENRPAPEGPRLLVVDEAGMVSDRQLNALLDAAAAHGARVVLAGDDRQLKSIEKGGLFGELAKDSAAELTTVYRQRDDWQKEASRCFAQGDTAAGLEAYNERGFIHYTEGDRTQAAADLVKQWVADRDKGGEGERFVFSVTNKDAHAVNDLIQAEQIKAGIVKEAHAYTVKEPNKTNGDEPAAERKILIGEGDRVQFRANDKERGIFNGMLATVERIEAEAPHVLHVRLDNGTAKEINTEEYNSIQLGYAGTTYRGQGKTLERSYVLFSPYMDERAAYVSATRAKDATHIYTATDDLDARYYRGHVRDEGLPTPESNFEKLVSVIDSRTAYNKSRPAPEPEPKAAPAPALARPVKAPPVDRGRREKETVTPTRAAPLAPKIEARAAPTAAPLVDTVTATTHTAARVLSVALNVVAKPLELVADAFEGILGGGPPVLTPEQLSARDEARAEAAAEAKEERRTKTAADRLREALDELRKRDADEERRQKQRQYEKDRGRERDLGRD